MSGRETFGECLKKLMSILNLKGSIVARGINVDSSLVYKWLRNERVPAYNSPHIDLIADYLNKCILNSFQQKSIIRELEKLGCIVSESGLSSISAAIRTCLLESQGYTIEIYRNNRTDSRRNDPSHSGNSSGYLNPAPEGADAKDLLGGSVGPKDAGEPETQDFIHESDSFCNTEYIKSIKGTSAVYQAALSLLKSAPDKPDTNNDTILITANSDVTMLPNYDRVIVQWNKALKRILKNGWNIIFLICLNNNIENLIGIIKCMQLAPSISKYSVYYYRKEDRALPLTDLIIVPGAGAMHAFSLKSRDRIESAFLFQSKESIQLITELFSQYFSAAKPLFNLYPSQRSTELQSRLVEMEEVLGDRYVLKGDINTITMPIDLYEKYLRISNKPEHEVLLRSSFHRRRLAAFETQIKYFKYKDIWFKEAIERLIDEKKYSFDQYYILEDNIPEDSDIIRHLENVADMLEKYENCEIAIVSEKDFRHIPKLILMEKENYGMLIETINTDTLKKNKRDNYDSEINLLISEKEVMRLFHNYFISIWNSIGYNAGKKKQVIEWLRGKIKQLKTE